MKELEVLYNTFEKIEAIVEHCNKVRKEVAEEILKLQQERNDKSLENDLPF